MPVEVGVGYVSIVPETRGFGRLLEQQLAGESEAAGVGAGREAGQGFLGGAGGVLKAGAAAVGAAAGVLFAAGFVKAVEQDKSNAKLAAQLGLSEREAARAGKLAGKVYAAGYGESIDQVNASLRALSQNGVAAINAPKREIAGLSKAALNLAETFNADVSESARAAGQLIRTGLAKDGREAFDLLTLGFQNGADRAEDYLDTVNEYSTQFRKIGLNGAASIGLISQAMQAGARDSDVAGDSLKEFSIRVLDGSKTTADGYKMLGLSADDMAARFAKGGKSATEVLDLTLDKLRAIPDPVKQSQAAVALFGTQAEDLGAALYAMDPTTAAAGLGKVGGAADKMGKSLHNTATNDLEVFKRQALQGLADFAAKYALPALRGIGGFLNTYVLPAAQAVGGVLAAVLVPAVSGMASAFMGAVGWVREYGAWLIPLGVAIGGVAVVAGASTIATWGMTAAFTVYRGIILAAAAVTRGWAVAQGILNAVMSANPVGLVVVGIMALVAALVVAYNKSESFRSIVQAAWQGIQTAASFAWNTVLKPALTGIWTALQTVGTWAMWLWQTVLQPVFSFIWTAAKVLFAIVVTAVFTPIWLAIQAVGAVASWLWTSVLSPVFTWIGDKALWLWDVAIKPAFDGISAGISAIGAVASWLWDTVFSPVFTWIGDKAAWLWNEKIQPAWLAMQIGMGLLGDKISELWDTYAKPVFQWIGDKAAWLWDTALKPAFDAIKEGASLVGDAFEDAKEMIGKAWTKIKDLAKGPVNFILEFVYTKGIKAVWDKVAGFVGLDKLPAAPKLLAEGGRTRGGIPGKDSIPALMMADEFVVKRSSARSVGFGTLEYINRTGQLPPAPVQRFAEGGVVEGALGWLGDKARAIGDVVMNSAEFLADPRKAWETLTGFIRGKIAEIGSSPMAKALAGLPRKMLSGLKDKILSAAQNFLGLDGGGGGGSWARPVRAGLGTRYGVAGRMWSSGYHTGSDFPAASGTPVGAVANGTVASASSGGPYGNHITISHGGGLSSLYAHLSSMAVAAGQKVKRSQRIGAVGSTGNSSGPHLHLEARRNGRTINPEPFLGYADGGRPRAGEIAWVGEEGPELVRFGSGGATVWDHRTSLGMVAGLGARGFAKGTSGATARKQLPGDLSSFTKSLTGSASDIAKAAKTLADDLKATGKAGKALAKTTAATSTKLQALATQRDSVDSRLAAGRQAQADQRKSASDYLGISQVSGVTSVGGLISGLQARQSTLTSFQSAIKQAQKRGASQSLVQQLVALGPDSELARMVSGASAGDMKRLNSVIASGAKLSSSYGSYMADAMYDAGSQAGKGFLAGLKAQEAELQAQMTRLGGSLVKSIKKELKIKSPSRETQYVGEQVGAGLVGGMVRALPQIDRAAVQMAAAAVPSVGPAAAAAGQQAAAGGLRAGDTLVLRVGEREFVAVVDERVDAGLNDVRRRTRAGSKKG